MFERALSCCSCALFLVFPEDLGEHEEHGAASILVFQGMKLVAANSCQLTGAEIQMPLGLLTNVPNMFSDVYPGWPSFSLHDSLLWYTGPLPNKC